MPRIFRKKGFSGSAAVNENDDMTIASGWSMGGSSVSDRIMGRMKLNLSFRSGGGNARNINSGASVGSGLSSGGNRRRKRSNSTGRFGARAQGNNFNATTSASVDGGGGRTGSGSSLLRSQSSRRFRNNSGTGSTTSAAGVEAMEDMDSNEAMTLRGQTLGRRRSSRAMMRGVGGGHSQTKLDTSVKEYEPVEYSLEELQSMEGDQLELVMYQAGVPPKDISNTLNQAASIDTSGDKTAEERRKSLLVALFVNSGQVRLVQKDSTNAERGTAVSTLTQDRDTADSALSISSTLERGLDDSSTGDRGSISSSKADKSSPRKSSDRSKRGDDRGAVFSSTGSVDASESVKSKLRKSKLDKIAELKTENTKFKRENKSLKKTVKKLLGQLTDAINDKEQMQKTLDESHKSLEEREKKEPIGEQSENDVSQNDNAKTSQDEEATTGTNSTKQPPYDVVVNLDEDHLNATKDSSITHNRRKSDFSTSSGKSVKTLNKNIAYLKRKLKMEREAHQNTEFRLKAEIDILTKEVDGLQRELGLSLESLDKAKKRSRETRESTSNLKRDLRNASTKIEELTAEAEARDKLIETFSKILLQKAGLEDGEVDNNGGEKALLEESLADGVLIGQLEESVSAIELAA